MLRFTHSSASSQRVSKFPLMLMMLLLHRYIDTLATVTCIAAHGNSFINMFFNVIEFLLNIGT